MAELLAALTVLVNALTRLVGEALEILHEERKQ